jgi:tripartite-type tricarboxylate transporter receptor subunit TctC
VPTIAESGYKGFEAVTWFGILGPANLPKDVVAKLNADINKALKDPELEKKLGAQGADVAGSTPEQFAKLIRDDIGPLGKDRQGIGRQDRLTPASSRLRPPASRPACLPRRRAGTPSFHGTLP